MKTEKFIKISILFIISAVVLGAIGSHYFKEILSVKQLSSLQTGVRYQLFHAIALLVLSLNSDKFNHQLNKILVIMAIGVFCFSFSIYFLSMQDLIGISLSFLSPITPVGGILLIYAWVVLFFNIKK